MRCKKHPTDLSSSVGVCASCLRHRLLALIAAQAQVQAQIHHSHSRAAPDDHRPPPLVFPRSVSPYVTRRKSDDTHTWHHHHPLFYSTPQVGPTYGSVNTTTDFTASQSRSHRKKTSRFSLFSNLFGSRSDKLSPDLKASDPGVCPRYSCDASSSSSPSSWLSTIFSGRRKKQPVMYMEEAIGGERKTCGIMDRGMSPARGPESEDWECLSSAEASPGKWRRTPAGGTRRTRQGQGKNINMSGLTFCMSPLVRASPSRHWNKNGMTGEMGVGEIRGPTKPHLSTAASYCANRSRKLVDLGRGNHNR